VSSQRSFFCLKLQAAPQTAPRHCHDRVAGRILLIIIDQNLRGLD